MALELFPDIAALEVEGSGKMTRLDEKVVTMHRRDRSLRVLRAFNGSNHGRNRAMLVIMELRTITYEGDFDMARP
jgi:hypothetical protein